MIDVHCHLEFKNFDADREKVLEESKQKLKAIINSGCEPNLFKKVKNIAEDNKGFVFPTYGLHPSKALDFSAEEIEKYKRRIKENLHTTVAIGEIGLDYYHVKEKYDRRETEKIFLDWLHFSDELELPALIHTRNAMKDTLKILEKKEKNDIIIHCFSGRIEDLVTCIDRGYYISIGGLIFRSNIYKSLIKRAPLDKILLETDAPFMAKEKSTRNNPWFIKEVAEEIANIKETSFSKVWRKCGKNAIDVFDLPLQIK